MVNLSNATSLSDKLEICSAHDDCSNTDLKAVFDLILDTAIENMIDFDTYNEMIQDYFKLLPENLKELNNYRVNGDIQNYVILVHAMKSNARSFGFMKLGDIAYNHEMAGKRNDVNYINSNFNELVNNVKEVYSIIVKFNSL